MTEKAPCLPVPVTEWPDRIQRNQDRIAARAGSNRAREARRVHMGSLLNNLDGL